jgi:hypothetical protein
VHHNAGCGGTKTGEAGVILGIPRHDYNASDLYVNVGMRYSPYISQELD